MSAADSAPPNSSAKPRKWLREAAVYGLLYGIPLLVLFPYTRWRPDAEFQSSVRTEAVDFTVGAYHKAGPFVGGCVDIYFESFGKVELPGTQQWRPLDGKGAGGSAENLWGGTVRFRNVDFRSLFLPAGTQVRMLWYEPSPDGVEMRLTYSGMPSTAGATVFLNEKSTVEFHSSSFSDSGASQSGLIQVPNNGRGMASIYPSPDLRFPVSVSPCSAASGSAASGSAASVKPTPQLGAESVTGATRPPKGVPEKPAALLPAGALPLSPGSGITFLTDDRDSAILGVNNTVQVRNAERKETLLRGQRLEIGRLKDRSPRDPSQITLQIKDGIVVNVLGRAGVLRIDGEDERPSLAEYLRARKVLSAWLTTSILLGSALLTIASRIKLVKLDEKDS